MSAQSFEMLNSVYIVGPSNPQISDIIFPHDTTVLSLFVRTPLSIYWITMSRVCLLPIIGSLPIVRLDYMFVSLMRHAFGFVFIILKMTEARLYDTVLVTRLLISLKSLMVLPAHGRLKVKIGELTTSTIKTTEHFKNVDHIFVLCTPI